MIQPLSSSSDKTLLDFEIEQAVSKNAGFIEGFDPTGLKGAAYCLHSGDKLYIADATHKRGITHCKPEKLTSSKFAGQLGFSIEPGRSVVLRTKERIHMPHNMMAQLWLRATWQLRGLSYDGGIIDPGYWGYLFIGLVNTSDEVIEIPVKTEKAPDTNGEDAIINMEIKVLSADAHNPMNMDCQNDLPTNREPRPPKVNPYSPVELTKRLDQLSRQLSDIQQSTSLVLRIVDLGFFAIIAGLVVAVGNGALQFGQKLGGDIGLEIGIGIAAFVVIVILTALFTAVVRGRRRW